ncbi:hypothetical protein ACHHYP_13239 [Achlya hypogyna]|uniref:Uncharacterized protein n=1 Tax=Achlya hypogyna TaxID=1202772 RepID=A0A1V9YFY5_ACHHY|nr:hypothetical protein ACHHYP_13239 [Achlya hypogyna]
MLRRLLGRPARSAAAIDVELNAVVSALRGMGNAGSSKMLTPANIEAMLAAKTTNAKQLYRMGQAIFENAQVDANPAELDKVKTVWKTAMELGDQNAKFSYARLLKQGQGFPKPDLISSTMLFKQLADAKHAWGTFAYAQALHNGDGIKVNLPKAFELYLLCAKSDIPPAYMAVANMYITGAGVDKNVPEALQWYTKAAESGDMHAKSLLGDWYFNGDYGVPVDRARGLALRMEAASAGIPHAMFNMGCLHAEGAADVGVERNDIVAFQLFQQAAMKGHGLAIMNVAVMLRDGVGVSRNVQVARTWLEGLAPYDMQAKELLAKLPAE